MKTKLVKTSWRYDGSDIMDGGIEIAQLNKYHMNCDSNGRLLAAAPDLLEAAKVAFNTASFLAGALPLKQNKQALAMMEFAALLAPAIEKAEKGTK